MKDWYKRLSCFMGWHSYWAGFNHIDKGDGFLTYASCKWCDYEGQIDSQGNLF